jgi:hypothetical protein
VTIPPELQPVVDRIVFWRSNPLQFVREMFNVEPDPWQIDALEAYADPLKQRISMQACVGPGKSALLAWCGWHFLLCQGNKIEHPKGAAVSITADNLKDNLWPEMSKWQSQSPLLMHLFTWTKERIFAKDHPETWFLAARSWSKTANEDEQGRTLSGLHSQFVLAMIDESGDVPVSVLKAAEQALSNCTWGKILQAGNPTSLTGMLHSASQELAHQWTVLRISGDPDDPKAWVHSKRLGPGPADWAREQIKTFGRDDPWVKSTILGVFPPSSINALLTPDEVRDSMARHLMEPAYEYAQRRLGIDVARFGDDRTVLFPRQGLAAFKPAEMRGATGPEIASRAALARERWEWEVCPVDDTGGFGGSVIDSMNLAGLPVVPVNFSSKATDPRYFNLRSEMWFRMRDWIRAGGSLPNEPDLLRELTAPTYTFDKGKFRLEEKEQIKKRLKYSPDKADALSLTFWTPDVPTQRFKQMAGNTESNHKSEWDPLAEKS